MYLLVHNNDLNGSKFYENLDNVIEEICEFTNSPYSLFQFKKLDEIQYQIRNFNLEIFIIDYTKIYNDNNFHYNYSKFDDEYPKIFSNDSMNDISDTDGSSSTFSHDNNEGQKKIYKIL